MSHDNIASYCNNRATVAEPSANGMMNVGCGMSTQFLWFLSGQFDESQSIRHIPVHSTPFTVGRRGTCTLSLPSPSVSGLHAEITIEGERLCIRDLSSTNGTYVNGKRIASTTPINDNDLIHFADVTFRIRRQDTKTAIQTQVGDICDQAMSLVQFDRIMSERAVVPFYQTIVNLHDRETIGYEVLGRSNVFGMETPDAMFRAASQLDLEVELSRMFRWEGIRCVASLPNPIHLFVNTHPTELEKPGLIESLQAVRDVTSDLGLTLEIHEAAVTDAKQMRELRAALNDLDIRLAYDDFGAGQNRLLELIEVCPDYLKYDMSWVREINNSPERRHVLSLLVRMTRELNIVPLAEGIETEDEHQACCEIGFELAQGFLYGKPAPVSNI